LLANALISQKEFILITCSYKACYNVVLTDLFCRCCGGFDRTTLSIFVLSLVLIGLSINSVIIITKRDWNIVNEVSPIIRRPLKDQINEVEYIREYLSAAVYVSREEWQPLTAEIRK